MFENFCSDIIQIMKCFALESFNLSCQTEHTKINSQLNFNPGLVLIAFSTTRSRYIIYNTRYKLHVLKGKLPRLRVGSLVFFIVAPYKIRGIISCY